MADELMEARKSFVAMIKEENSYSDYSKQSLKQHWLGARDGFADHMANPAGAISNKDGYNDL